MVRPELDETQPAAPAASDPARTATLAGAPASAPRSTALAPGMRLDHFRIERKLGAGGMGEVYLATDLALDRPVAIKVLPTGTTSGAANERMVREARAQARIQHPNVAHIYFVGEDSGRLYFAMEYIAGQTLAEKLAGAGATKLAPDEALEIIRAAALGLREAQRAGFLHRDVKPSNLMLDAHGNVKVLDFGLAAAAPGALGDGPDERSDVAGGGGHAGSAGGAGGGAPRGIVQTSLAGTPLYMAPEQAAGGTIDFRADIYALGATLYHLVSGKPPFQADTVAELLTMHRTAERPSLRGAAPRTAAAAIDGLIARMMAQRPEDRFASYDELLRAIELASTVHTRPAGFWVRLIASGVDLVIAALALILVQLPIRGDAQDNGLMIVSVGAPYAILALWRWGTTGGKALFELEVISILDGKKPRLSQILVRELAILGGAIVFGLAELAANHTGHGTLADVFGGLAPGSVGLAVLLLWWAALRTPGKRAPWDRASGTLVRYRTGRR